MSVSDWTGLEMLAMLSRALLEIHRHEEIETGMIILLRKIVANPYLNLLVGLSLLYTSGSDAWYELQTIDRFHLGTHHGVILFALLHILKTVPDLFEGLEHINNAESRTG
ncbi:MAG: hypothetical protein ABW096_09320 [Candidatus Thiodiazotropha sp.]